jgi:hypothetical protein
MLEEDNLVTISAAYNSLYTDNQENQQLLPDTVFIFLENITIGQKVLIFEKELGRKV